MPHTQVGLGELVDQGLGAVAESALRMGDREFGSQSRQTNDL